MVDLKTIKSEGVLGLNLALDKFLSEGWEIARNRYQKVINAKS